MGRLNVRFDAQSLREMFFNCQGRLNCKPFILRLSLRHLSSHLVAMLLYTLFYSGHSEVADGAAIDFIVEVIAIYTHVVRDDLGMGQPLAILYLSSPSCSRSSFA